MKNKEAEGLLKIVDEKPIIEMLRNKRLKMAKNRGIEVENKKEEDHLKEEEEG